MAEKSVEEIQDKNESKSRDQIKYKFWNELLNELKGMEKFTLFNNISPSKDNYISSSSGIAGISYNFVVTKDYTRVELYISNFKTEFNKTVFDKLYLEKEKIEKSFKKTLEWERLDEKKACRIKSQRNDINIYNDDWEKIIKFLVNEMIKFEETLREPLKEIKKNISK